MDWNKEFLENIPDAHIKAIISMFYTSHRHIKLLEKVLKPYEISHEQFSVLKILQTQFPEHFSLKDIQIRLFNQTANTTRLVEKLRKKGFVESITNPANRRQLNIKITKQGLDILDQLEEPMVGITKKLKIAISETEAKKLISVLTKIQQIEKED